MIHIAMRLRAVLGSVCVLIGCAAHAGDLKMQADPAFVGYGQANGTYPLAVLLANSGPDTRGSLRVSTGDFQMDYPIELPRGSTKRLIAYPRLSLGSEISLDLSTSQGSIRRQIQPSPGGAELSAQSILLVSDTEGDLAFLRPLPGEGVGRLEDCYVKPELAPDRMVAYTGMTSVVLGAGSERLSDGAVRALHNYMAGGGTVVFLGGASSPALADSRWADVLPVVPKLPKTVKRSELITNLSHGIELGLPFTILDSAATAGSEARVEEGNIILARHDVGLGKAVFLAFNPLEPPFTRWSQRRTLFEKIVRPLDFDRASGYLDGFMTANIDPETGAITTGSSSTPRGRYNPTTGTWDYRAETDPFNTELPPTTKVFWILSSYFVVIIPVNFLLLKKLKRGELAWFTAPLISIGFAGAFFAAARDLYSARLSTATQGLLIATNTGSEAVFVGKSQLFFPQGGEYDLKMNGVDSIFAPQSESDYSYGRSDRNSGLEDLNPIDIGQIKASRMDVNNLSFREIAYESIVPRRRWLSVSVSRVGGVDRLSVTNVGPYALSHLSAIVAGKALPIVEPLAPGQSTSFALPAKIVPDSTGQSANVYSYGRRSRGSTTPYSGLTELTTQTKEVVIKGLIDGSPVGPQIGSVVQERQGITLAYFTGIHIGKVSL